MKKIIIPIHAGSQYRVGETGSEGNRVFSTEALKQHIKFEKGEIYSAKRRAEIVENIVELYRNEGYFFARIIPVESLDRSRKLVNLTFKISEGEVVYLNRLEFRGNFSLFGLGNYDISQMVLSLSRSTLDNPLLSTKGTFLSASCKFTGSFLPTTTAR